MSHPGHQPTQDSSEEWQLETGVYSRDVNTQRLKKLELNDLTIAETGRRPRPPGLTDPNDHSSTADGNVGNDPYNGDNGGALNPEAAPLRPKPLDPKKLEEWLALRKRVDPSEAEEGEV